MSKNLKFLLGCGGLAGAVLTLVGCCFTGMLVVTFGNSAGKTAHSTSTHRLVRFHLPTLTPTSLPSEPLLPVDTFPPVSAIPVDGGIPALPQATTELQPEIPLPVEAFTPIPPISAEVPLPEATLVPVPLSTGTPLPPEAFTPVPTAVLAIAEAPTMTPTPTEIILPTETPTATPVPPTPTEVIPTEEPTATPIPVTPAPLFTSCDCSGDEYDCDDFDSWSEAQGCFEYCQGAGVGDPHKLDENGNFYACEGMY